MAQRELTKEALVEKARLLFESGRPQKALDLIGQNPEFSEETEILHLKSVAYVDLRDFKRADLAFQKQFDVFLKNAESSRDAAEKILAENALAKENKSLALMMYSTSMISYATADLVDSVRAVAFEKAGLPPAATRRISPASKNSAKTASEPPFEPPLCICRTIGCKKRSRISIRRSKSIRKILPLTKIGPSSTGG